MMVFNILRPLLSLKCWGFPLRCLLFTTARRISRLLRSSTAETNLLKEPTAEFEGIQDLPDCTTSSRVGTARSRAASLFASSKCLVAACCLIAIIVTSKPAPAQAQANQPQAGFVQLNLQGDTPLKVLIDLVSQRLDVNFMYTEETGNRKITVRAPSEIPVSSLLGLLSSVLRMERLVLVDADIPGWKRIVDAREMLNLSNPGEAKQILEAQGPAAPVTQVFPLKHVSAQQLSTTLQPFLSKSTAGTGGSSMLALRESNSLIVTDYAPIVMTIERLIKLIDQPRGDLTYEFYTVEHTAASALAKQVRAMLGSRRPAAPGTQLPEGTVELLDEPRTNQIVVVGPQPKVADVLLLLQRFDVSLGLVTRVYRVQNTQAERFDRIIKGFLSAQDTERLYTSSVDKDGNLLIVRATPEIHERIGELQEQIDVPVKSTQSPIRFYKLKNANALDVLYTILSLQEVSGQSSIFGDVPVGTGVTIQNEFAPGRGPYPGMSPGGATELPDGTQLPRGVGESPARTRRGVPFPDNQVEPFRLPVTPDEELPRPIDTARRARADRLSSVTAQAGFGTAATLPGGARAAADPTTNSIVIAAPIEAQEMYKDLIESLDVRRPQVLIDAKIVAVDTSDDFTLGVEISGGDRQGVNRLFGFSSFGLSQVDPVTGALQIIPMNGFNGTLVNPEIADVVVQALARHTRARVLSSPRILVNDNSTGQLESVSSVPFESINVVNTIQTQSLGGNQQAGTLITVTPHISEDDHLMLDFSVEFSTFTGTATAGLPPPRQIDRVGSTVTVPDGQTVIVGGLKRTGETYSMQGIPYLEKIPLIRDLSTIKTNGMTSTSFFLFIRPVILRADKFEDLKHLSTRSLHVAEIGGDYPDSRPLLVEQH